MSGKVSGLQSLTLLQKEILDKYFFRIFSISIKQDFTEADFVITMKVK